MLSSEKFCLKWNDFQENVNGAFSSMRKDNSFCDVTLACEDGHQVEAHKVVLAASSPFFENILNRNKHIHPLIYMRGLKSEDLIAIVDFLYYGEANIFEAKLETFLCIAEELKLKGLAGEKKDDKSKENCVRPSKILAEQKPKYNNQNEIKSEHENITVPEFYHSDSFQKGQNNVERAVSISKDSYSGDLHELDDKIKTMMVLGDQTPGRKTVYNCQVCGKKGQGMQIRDHIEANHLEGIVIPCNRCDKTYRSRNALRCHKRTHHK